MSGLWLVSYVLMWLLLLTMAVLLVSVLRNLGVVYALATRSPGHSSGLNNPPPSDLTKGDVLPEATWTTIAGDLRRVTDFAGMKTAFAVVSPSCGGCGDFLQYLEHHGPDPLDDSVRNLVVISLGEPEASLDLVRRSGLDSRSLLVLDRNTEVMRRWGISTTPGLVIVDERMRVVRQVFTGGALRELHTKGAAVEASQPASVA